ncbi:hypothetical protein M2277_005145 [Paenibacillus sp. LBL]|uniref:hypothetical protein n=1 Tax=Paenibacillus TaxID=44249 RepID=UPI002474F072|nr:hypothetical protein [Paenibacillus sp. LBL]MDH6674449.1 hypothetical protein [Paenibacillus sp. LBL]
MTVKQIDIFKWSITGVQVTSPRTSVIGIYIPGTKVNSNDRIYVRLNAWDRLRGVSLEDKTVAELKKWERICAMKNTEIERCRASEKIISTRHRQWDSTKESDY